MPNTADYLNQLIDDRNDLADNLVTMGVAASHSETFTELVPKVLSIPSGSNIGYEVKFKVDGNDYYVASCQQGESISAPPDPIGGNKMFWQINGTNIQFPYIPDSDVIINGVASVLPSGYTALQYLEANGSQYINTGVKPYDYGGLGIVVNDFTPISFISGYFGNKFFSCATEVSTGQDSSGLSVSGNYLRLDFNGDNYNFASQFTYGTAYKVECGYSQTLSYAYARLNNVIEVTQSQSYNPANKDFQILSAFMDEVNNFPANARFGETIITTSPISPNTLKGTTELRHFYPCLDDNNVPCMYDAITRTTFYNAGTGTFLYG